MSATPSGAAPGHPLAAVRQLPGRIRRGRPRRLLLRAVIASVLSLVVLQLIPGSGGATTRARTRSGRSLAMAWAIRLPTS